MPDRLQNYGGCGRNKKITEADCALCASALPTARWERSGSGTTSAGPFDALADPEKITVVQVAPAVRTAWGETLGLSREFATVKRLVAALRRMGFDYIFDTTFSADLTIMERQASFWRR